MAMRSPLPTTGRRLPSTPPTPPSYRSVYDQPITFQTSDGWHPGGEDRSFDFGEPEGRGLQGWQGDVDTGSAHAVGGDRGPSHRSLLQVNSAQLAMRSISDQEMIHPLRSQSFKHRPRPLVELRRYPLDDVPQERRRSTPNVSRRCSLTQRSRTDTPRRDVWPEAKATSEAEERFLKLPDSEDYTRVRQFKIDEKGAVVSRGDSFRRKKLNRAAAVEGNPSRCSLPSNGSEGARDENCSRSLSASSNEDLKKEQQPPCTSHCAYKIYVLGASGTGKSSLISQFITSEYRNTFATEIENFENSVSVNIGGQETELTFYEADPQNDDSWLDREVQIYLLVYSIDSRSSFKQAMYVVERLRESVSTKNMPLVMAGNKVDLERKRAVSKSDAKSAALTYAFAHYEISVALNHDVDDLLVGLIAEIKESFNPKLSASSDDEQQPANIEEHESGDHSDFKAAIRRFSQRKKRQMGVEVEVEESSKCTNLKPSSLIDRLRNWRRALPRLPQ